LQPQGKQCFDISRRTVIKSAVALGALGSLASVRTVAADNPPRIGIVNKIRIPWFENLERGVKNAAEDPRDHGLGVPLPSSDDPALQVRAIEDLIAQVDVVGVMPIDGAVLESVFKRPQEAGIGVIVHEQPGQRSGPGRLPGSAPPLCTPGDPESRSAACHHQSQILKSRNRRLNGMTSDYPVTV
jgi:ABC-type sugar transport system substrate-binding protein